MKEAEWKARILADYPGQDAMTALVCKPVVPCGDQLAEYVYTEVMDSNSQAEALRRLKSGLADLSIMVWELDRRINHEINEDPTSNVDTVKKT